MNPADTGSIYNAAMKRSFLIAFLTALTAVAYEIRANSDWRELVFVCIITAVPIILVRGLGEGYYDAGRATSGNMNAGDVPMASASVDVTKVT